jgi:BirA family biotin operon repressor/biotin-[acetyl-CoA-carboxylase] ligase
MSTTAPISERTITAVLLALWRAGEPGALDGERTGAGAEVTIDRLLRETLAPLPDVHQALSILEQRQCLLERSPPPFSAVRLVFTGLPCWRDVLEDFARRRGLGLGKRVMVFARTGSTSDIAWQCAANAENDGLVVLANEQTAGRGRLGHAWHAKAGQSALYSIVLQSARGEALDRLTLLAGLATAEALEQVAREAGAAMAPIEIKWPNDLLIEGRKVAGILVESRVSPAGSEGTRQAAAVVGIGINVSQAGGGSDNNGAGGAEDFPAELTGRAISLYGASGRIIDRMRVVAATLQKLNHYLALAGDEKQGDSWIGAWKARCPLLGRRISLRAFGRTFAGEVVDIDPLFGLVVRDEAGISQFFSARSATLSA